MKKNATAFFIFIAALTLYTGCKKENKMEEKTLPAEQIQTEQTPVEQAQTELAAKEQLAAVQAETPVKEEPADDEFFTFSDPIEKYVCTDDGSNLNYRDSPSTGKVLGKFKNGTRLAIFKRTNKKYEIAGISDYWYYGLSDADIERFGGWVFGGFLEDSEIYDKLIGKWDSEQYRLEIERNGEIHLYLKESEGLGGNWELLKENILFFSNAHIYDEDPTSFTWKIKFVDDEKLIYDWDGTEYTFTADD